MNGEQGTTPIDKILQKGIAKLKEMRPVLSGQGEYIIYCPECKIVDFLSKHAGHLDLHL